MVAGVNDLFTTVGTLGEMKHYSLGDFCFMKSDRNIWVPNFVSNLEKGAKISFISTPLNCQPEWLNPAVSLASLKAHPARPT